MEINKILNANVLDIIFDGKNKDYGAYQLRKNYNKRLAKALMAMAGVLLVTFLGTLLANAIGKKRDVKLNPDVIMHLEKVPDAPKPIAPPPPPPSLPAPPPQVKITAFVPPVIVPDEEVKTPPPTVETLETSKIGAISHEGTDDIGIVAPPVETKGTGDVVAPVVVSEDYEKVFIKVESPAEFPGGVVAWRRFLERAMDNYPVKALENGTQGAVVVQLVVDKDGSITNVKALNDPGDGLGDYAVKIIKTGPHWKPAEQNGHKVTYSFKQTITFTLQ